MPILEWSDPLPGRAKRILVAGAVGAGEPPLRTILNDPDHIIRWAIRTHREHKPRVQALAEQRPELPIVWLSSRRQLKAWIDALAAPAPGSVDRDG